MRNLKKVLSLALALVMLLGMMVIGAGAATNYTDADQISNLQAAEVADALGIIQGNGGQFMPTTELDRAQAAQILARMLLGPDVAKTLTATNNKFVDAQGHWAAAAINYCANNGIVEGDGAVHFYPDNKVTGFQFAKMLLVALGYDAKIEGYNGSGWRTSVAVDALQAGLTQNVQVSDAVLTRDAAVQMVMNCLTADMVRYTLKTDTFGILDDVPNTKNDYRYLERNTGVNSGSNTSTPTNRGDETMQFCELHFPNLKLIENDVNGYGDILARWKLVKGNVTETISETNVGYAIQYTAAVSPAKVYSDLGMTGEHKAEYWVDGNVQEGGLSINAWNFGPFAGNGAVTTVWTNERGDAQRITVKNTWVGDVAAVNANGTVTVAPRLATETSGTVAGSGLAVGDVVLYMRCKGAMVSAVKTEPTTATLNGYTVDANVTLGTDTISYSAMVAQQAESAALGKTVKVVKDTYGYVLWVERFVQVGNFAYVVKQSGDYLGDSNVIVADLVLANGTRTTMRLQKNSLTPADGDLIQYGYDQATGMDKIVARQGEMDIDGATSNITVTTKGSPVVRASGASNNTPVTGTATTGYATDLTVFFVKVGANSYETYVGVANVPGMTVKADNVMAFTLNQTGRTDGRVDIINAVYVDASNNTKVTFSGTNNDVVFILNKYGNQGTVTAGVEYSMYAAVYGGNIVGAFNATSNLTTGLYAYVKDNKNGTYNVSSPITPVVGTTKYTAGGITLGAYAYSYDNNTKAFEVNAAGTDIKAFNVANIGTDSNDVVWLTETAGKLNLVVVQKVPGGEGGTPPPPASGLTGVNKVSATDLTTLGITNAADLNKLPAGLHSFAAVPTGIVDMGAGTIGTNFQMLTFRWFGADATLTIRNSANTVVWSKTTTGRTADADHYEYIRVNPTGVQNANNATLANGAYTWSISAGATTLSSGSLNVEW